MYILIDPLPSCVLAVRENASAARVDRRRRNGVVVQNRCGPAAVLVAPRFHLRRACIGAPGIQLLIGCSTGVVAGIDAQLVDPGAIGGHLVDIRIDLFRGDSDVCAGTVALVARNIRAVLVLGLVVCKLLNAFLALDGLALLAPFKPTDLAQFLQIALCKLVVATRVLALQIGIAGLSARIGFIANLLRTLSARALGIHGRILAVHLHAVAQALFCANVIFGLAALLFCAELVLVLCLALELCALLGRSGLRCVASHHLLLVGNIALCVALLVVGIMHVALVDNKIAICIKQLLLLVCHVALCILNACFVRIHFFFFNLLLAASIGLLVPRPGGIKLLLLSLALVARCFLLQLVRRLVEKALFARELADLFLFVVNRLLEIRNLVGRALLLGLGRLDLAIKLAHVALLALQILENLVFLLFVLLHILVARLELAIGKLLGILELILLALHAFQRVAHIVALSIQILALRPRRILVARASATAALPAATTALARRARARVELRLGGACLVFEIIDLLMGLFLDFPHLVEIFARLQCTLLCIVALVFVHFEIVQHLIALIVQLLLFFLDRPLLAL
eukprot:comp21888_c0_seq1/m.49629 comp21888_c0_seq1/g.49629  ORF comp21888_c0_seq1/g.49629 comp21888_c0_seq1/m.49629 type:complete len:573 (-) comp21888_c0_seq1:1287-3005(-)